MDSKRRRTPPIWWWLLLLISAGVIGYVQATGTPDFQIANVITFILVGVTLIALVVWFVFFSDYPGLVRLLTAVALLLALLLFFALFRVEDVTGELVPSFA